MKRKFSMYFHNFLCLKAAILCVIKTLIVNIFQETEYNFLQLIYILLQLHLHCHTPPLALEKEMFSSCFVTQFSKHFHFLLILNFPSLHSTYEVCVLNAITNHSITLTSLSFNSNMTMITETLHNFLTSVEMEKGSCVLHCNKIPI